MNNNKKNYIDALNEIKIDESIKKKVIYNSNSRKNHYKFNLKLVTSVAMAAVILLFIIGFNDIEINKSYESDKNLDKKYETLEDNLSSSLDNSYEKIESEKLYQESIVIESAKPNKSTSSGDLICGIQPNTDSTSDKNIKMGVTDMKVNKKIVIGGIVLIAVIIVAVVMMKKSNFNFVNKNPANTSTNLEYNGDITIVPTMQENLEADSAWCCTFQLVWNDMKNELVKQDVVFNPQLDVVVNLNKEEFKKSMISDNYYYKKFGEKSPNLKAEIEKGIKDKFGETSDVLDKIKWEESNNDDVKEYVFYAMLKREFEFSKEFDELAKGKFGTKYDDVSYFGVKADTNYEVKNQVDVLYYNSKDDFAIILNTKQNDEVILYKNPEGKTFDEIYKNMNNKAKNYKGKKYLEDIDELKVPNLKFNKFMSYEELKNKKFLTADGKQAEIIEAMQTIQFELDKKGGKIKSEAVVVMGETALLREDEPRYFYLDDTFAIFLREQGKDMPYFAARIDDISKFQ